MIKTFDDLLELRDLVPNNEPLEDFWNDEVWQNYFFFRDFDGKDNLTTASKNIIRDSWSDPRRMDAVKLYSDILNMNIEDWVNLNLELGYDVRLEDFIDDDE